MEHTIEDYKEFQKNLRFLTQHNRLDYDQTVANVSLTAMQLLYFLEGSIQELELYPNDDYFHSEMSKVLRNIQTSFKANETSN